MKSRNTSEASMKEIELAPDFKVTIGPLSGADSLTADDYIGDGGNAAKAQKIYALCAIQKINGKKVTPLASFDDFKETLEHFDGALGLNYLLQVRREFFAFVNESALAAHVSPEKQKSDGSESDPT
jgi:hypothetical protein